MSERHEYNLVYIYIHIDMESVSEGCICRSMPHHKPLKTLLPGNPNHQFFSHPSAGGLGKLGRVGHSAVSDGDVLELPFSLHKQVPSSFRQWLVLLYTMQM